MERGGLRVEKATKSFTVCPLLVQRAIAGLKTQSTSLDLPVPRAPCPIAHLSRVRLDYDGLAYNTGRESFDMIEDQTSEDSELNGVLLWEQWAGPAFDDGT